MNEFKKSVNISTKVWVDKVANHKGAVYVEIKALGKEYKGRAGTFKEEVAVDTGKVIGFSYKNQRFETTEGIANQAILDVLQSIADRM